MSEHIEYMKEKTSIDVLLNNGYTIKSITENLSGAFVEFERITGSTIYSETLHILTADARKYFSVHLINRK
ncbi:hypothetical protein MKX67_13075 [Cytobacillus sp. FSL W7-1323]|uniref:Uncharacterized protein n=1 Tax=Cytobacillus kochii TaxID=859143 RepID=A0A248TMW0_9BACI|nr:MULTISPECIES: hypothetical protein [Cytobacillus]ASV69492.1 hypothetical protein CKF48_20550 [Cytobacillus kochii]MCA1028206.1 hypothetical protein [Cytobacillus kochii]MCM3321108.1 hypothetical protein [Cytobacillus kochii]MCM3344059.1 hypothetical protein [Cytobacillus kochii]MDM5207904.1 hypothetical protein [Cytobacillus kochii]